MIEGDGFFVTRGGTEQLYTRAGSFDFDATGKLVTPDGKILQGWMADAQGVVNPNGPIGDLSVPYGQLVNPSRHHHRQRRRQHPVGDGGRRLAADRHHDVRQPGRPAEGLLQLHEDRPPANAWTLDIVHANGVTLVSNAAVTFDAAGALTVPASGSTARVHARPGRHLPELDRTRSPSTCPA